MKKNQQRKLFATNKTSEQGKQQEVDILEEMKKEVESLKKQTLYLKFIVAVMMINVIFFSITQVKQYCSVMNYYRQTIELNQEVNQILRETNQLQEEILSKTRQFLIVKTARNLQIVKYHSIVCKVHFPGG